MAFGDKMIAAAAKYRGTTYAWGGGNYDGPSQGIRDGGTADRYGDYKKVGFDCSGLVLYAAYQASGGSIKLPHRADQQARMGTAVNASTVAPGDVIAFSSNGGAFYHHIGIYVGNGSILNAPQSGDVVKVSPLSNWSGETKAYRRYGPPGGAVTSPSSVPAKKETSAASSTGTGSTESTTASLPEEEPLPAIGPAKQHELIPLTRQPYYDAANNRLAEVRVQGNYMTADLVTAITGASMSFSVTQVGQFSMTVQDTLDGSIIGSGIFRKGTLIDWRDQHLEVRGLDIRKSAGGPVLTVKARSRVIGVLRGDEHTGKGTWGEQDTTVWVLDRCREAGAIPIVQGGLGSLTFSRTTDDETTWDAMQRGAQQVGAWCYEFEQIVTFMRPTALATRTRARWWDLYWNSYTDYSKGLDGTPDYSWSADGGQGESLSFDLISGDADLARPGDGVTLNGNMGEALGDWVVVQVDLPMTSTAGVKVNCARIVDPAPQLSEAAA